MFTEKKWLRILIFFLLSPSPASANTADTFSKKEYSIQVASVKNNKDAVQFIKRFKEKYLEVIPEGQKVATYSINIKGVDYYRIRLVQFQTKDEASMLCEKLKIVGQACFVSSKVNPNETLLFKTSPAEARQFPKSNTKPSSSFLPYESSTPVMDTITLGLLALFVNGITSPKPAYSNSYNGYYTGSSSEKSGAADRNSRSKRDNKAISSGNPNGYEIFERISYSRGQNVVARGICGNGRKFNVKHYPANGASSRFYIVTTAGSSIENVSGKFCH